MGDVDIEGGTITAIATYHAAAIGAGSIGHGSSNGVLKGGRKNNRQAILDLIGKKE